MRSLCALLCFAFIARAADTPPKLRLSEVEDIQPAGYQAELTLDPAKNTFSGSIVIRMDVKQSTQTIWLNQERLQIQNATLSAGGQTLIATPLSGGDDYVGLHFESRVPVGAATATIQYTGGVVEKNSTAIFRQQEGGNWYIFSQFETTDARGAFPCFDEPSYKTPWQLTLHVPDTIKAISNTPAVSEKSADGMKTIVFKETKPLPSYLVAFAAGPFEFVDAGTAGKNKVPVRIVVPQGRTAQARYAAAITATIIDRHEEYFGIPYPWEKADQVAVPNTTGWGAMENPGMITYAQSVILADPKSDTLRRQRNYLVEASHELAHQWFGDLVTTAWWDDVWLNEAFATWMERKYVAEYAPELHSVVSDVGSKLGAEAQDSLISVRKIRQPILSKDDIGNAFDTITYEKGGSVIGMFENWLGPDVFQQGVRSYLTQYAFRAATSGDFLDALSTVAKRDVTSAFSSFLNQAGVPVVSVALDCRGGKATLQLAQHRSLPLGSQGASQGVSQGPSDELWKIPLCIRYGRGNSGRSECTLMTQASETHELSGGCPVWVQANDRALGYYQVDYKGGLLAALTAGDVANRLPATERVDLTGNAQALTASGTLPTADALSLVETFHADPEHYVVERAIATALRPARTLVPAELMPNYQRFLVKNFDARARETGWIPKPGEKDDDAELRPVLLQAVATWGGDKELAAQAKSLAERWLADRNSLDPNVVAAVLSTAAFNGDQALFDRCFSELMKTQDKQIRRRLLTAMGQFRDPAAIEAGMNALITGDIPFIEGGQLLFAGEQQAATRKLSLEFLKSHWDAVVTRMPTGGSFDFGSRLPRVGSAYCDATSRDELERFFAPRVQQFTGAPRELEQTLETIGNCIANKAAQGPGVAAFLAKY
jgi:alanyl aminopeptidase